MSTLGKGNLYRAFVIQLRVIHALLMREVITRYGRHGLGVLWVILEPMLFTLGVTALWYVVQAHTISNIPIVAFAVTGYSSVLIWRNAANRCSKAIEPNLALMYHRNVKVIDIFLSRIILEWIGATASIAFLTILFSTSSAMPLPQNMWPVIAGWIFLAWFSLGLGLIVGALSERFEAFERIWHVVIYLLFPLSGAIFMVHWLPKAVQDIILWLPMVHGVEMIRHGYFGSIVPTYENPVYFAVANLILTLIGLILVRETSKRVQPE